MSLIKKKESSEDMTFVLMYFMDSWTFQENSTKPPLLFTSTETKASSLYSNINGVTEVPIHSLSRTSVTLVLEGRG